MLYLSIIFFVLSIFSSIFIYKKCSEIKSSKDSVLPLYELLVCTYKLPPSAFYILPNIVLFGLILFFRFVNLDFSLDSIHELIKVFVISQIGYYLICVDLKTFIIPNKITFPTILCLLAFCLIPPIFQWQSFVCALIAFAIIFALQIINPNGIGGGDAKLCAILGFMFSMYMESIYFVLVGFILGGLISLILMKSKLISKKDCVPYGVYFYIGACLIYAFAKFIFIY